MSQTIVRLFGNLQDAEMAAAKLNKSRFQDVFVISRPENGEGIVETIMAAYVWKGDAQVLAEGVAAGGTLIVVHAPFGAGGTAIAIMSQFRPIDSGLADVTTPAMPWDEAAPLSSALQMPVLLSDKATFAAFAGLPALGDSNALSSGCIGLPLLSGSETLSSKIGLPTLMDNAAPLSSALKLPVLTRPRH